MPWEIADRDHPTRAGARFDTIDRAAQEADKAEPRGRFYVRWVSEEGQADNG